MFIFDATNIILYQEYVSFIHYVKNKFDKERKILFRMYNITNSALWDGGNVDGYIDFRNKYRKLRQDIINEIIKKFRNFLPENCLIYEFGSLAKFTDRIESDVDLTFCFDEQKNSIFECTEELINYAIAYVFEHSIDHIHGKFQHYPIIHDYDNLTEEDNFYVLKFGQDVIEYKCGPETLIENIMGKKNVRDYQSLIDGYLEKYTLQCDIECLYSIIILENSTQHDFVGDLAQLENQHDIFSGYQFIYQQYNFEDKVKVSCIKKAFKTTIVSMYVMISFLRTKVKWLKQYSMTVDDFFESEKIIDIFDREYIELLKKSFIKMIFYWDKIELLLKANDVSLSSRCHKIFSKQELNSMLYTQYGEEYLMDSILSSINELNTCIFEGWRFINEY